MGSAPPPLETSSASAPALFRKFHMAQPTPKRHLQKSHNEGCWTTLYSGLVAELCLILWSARLRSEVFGCHKSLKVYMSDNDH